MSDTAEDILRRYNWKRVTAPRPWTPSNPGEELIGYYGGRTKRNGPTGQFDVIVVHVPQSGAFTVSGTQLIQLCDGGRVEPGHPVRVIYQGMKPLSGERHMKMFDLLVSDGERIPAEALPEIRL